jgi:hypothetical protein
MRRALRRRTLAVVRSEAPPRGGWALLGLGLCAALLLGGLLYWLSDPAARPHGAQIAQGPGSVRASLRRTGSYAELSIAGLVQPPADQVYEVWLERGASSAPQPTDALFTVTSRGTASVEVPGSLRGVTSLMVTSEPIGGSRTRTGPAALTMRLGASRPG